jgi:hypothetical protein
MKPSSPKFEVVAPVEPHACSFRHCSPATLRAPATRIHSPTPGCKVRQLGWTNPTLLLKKLSEGLQPEPQGNSTATSPKQPPFHRACLASILTCSPGWRRQHGAADKQEIRWQELTFGWWPAQPARDRRVAVSAAQGGRRSGPSRRGKWGFRSIKSGSTLPGGLGRMHHFHNCIPQLYRRTSNSR